MNVRKSIDYSILFAVLDKLVMADLPQMELYHSIGRLVSGRPEKGAAVAASEYLRSAYPDATGFSPRNLRRMREFYRTYESEPEMLAQAMTIGWTQNVVIQEAELTLQEKEWYIRAVRQFDWSKQELIKQIESAVHLKMPFDVEEDVYYTEKSDITESVNDNKCGGARHEPPHPMLWRLQFLSPFLPERTISKIHPLDRCAGGTRLENLQSGRKWPVDSPERYGNQDSSSDAVPHRSKCSNHHAGNQRPASNGTPVRQRMFSLNGTLPDYSAPHRWKKKSTQGSFSRSAAHGIRCLATRPGNYSRFASVARCYEDTAQLLNIGFSDAGDWKIDLTFDGVHFSEVGHLAFAKGVEQALAEIFLD